MKNSPLKLGDIMQFKLHYITNRDIMQFKLHYIANRDIMQFKLHNITNRSAQIKKRLISLMLVCYCV